MKKKVAINNNFKKISFGLIWGFYIVVCLEIGSFSLAKLKLIPFVATPKLYQSLPDGHVEYGEWRNELFEWGAWRKPLAKTTQEGSCFKVNYESNSIGVRDREFFKEKNKKRVVLLGDSFAEGYGVGLADTAAKAIERKTGVEVYNFGTSGSVGPVQYDIIYEKIAKNYYHDILLIFFLPENDFNDNDYEHWKFLGSSTRYRPYWRKISENTYDYFVPSNAIKTTDFNWSKDHPTRAFFRKYFWAYNVYQTYEFYYGIYSVSKLSKVPMREILDNWKGYSGYLDATSDQQEAVIFFMDKIMINSPANKIILVSIPSRSDYTRLASGADMEAADWYKAFSTSRKRLNKDIEFIDLLKYPMANPDSLFLSCDAHWGPGGNSFVADIVSELIRK